MLSFKSGSGPLSGVGGGRPLWGQGCFAGSVFVGPDTQLPWPGPVLWGAGPGHAPDVFLKPAAIKKSTFRRQKW